MIKSFSATYQKRKKEMDRIVYTIFTLIATPLALLLIAFLYLMLKTFSGKSIKDPSYPPVYGAVLQLVLFMNVLYDYQTKLAKNQQTFRFLLPGQSNIYTVDTRNVEHILKTKFDKYSKGEYNKDIIKDLLGQGIFAVDGDKWKQQRKLASFEFSTRVLRDFSCAVFKRNAAKLVRIVNGFAVAGLVFDVQDILMRCTLDSIFKVGFGVDLNCLNGSSKEETDFMKAFDDSNALIYWRYGDPLWKLKRFLNIGSEASLKKKIKVIDDFCHKLISTKRKQLALQRDCNDKEDILSRFLVESEMEKDPKTMNDRYLRDIILNFIIAGKDTTANTLSWFICMLCKNPIVQAKIAQEVVEVTGTQENGVDDIDDFMENITDAALDRMHYLHAALTETLRLYPAVPMDGKVAEIDDVLPDGFRIKKGDGVYFMSYAMGRMPYIWGEDAEDYRPERWLNNGVFQPESPFKFISFNAGPRICLGKEFSYRQMKIVSVALLHYFRFKLADDTKKVTYRTMFTLHIKGGLPICAISRASSLVIILSIFTFNFLTRTPYINPKKNKYHPIGGTIFNQFLNFNRLHHYMTHLAAKYKTYRVISPFKNEVYTSDPANVEYILQTNFANYGKGCYNYTMLKDLLGDGIFTVDGAKWRQQRKVSSYEFSTKVLRDFSSVVFRKNAAKLANAVSEAAKANRSMDIQDLFMKSALDSIFKVAFGVELDSMCGSSEEGAKFSKAFDDASAMTLYRYVDILWKIKRFLNIGSEAVLKRNVKAIDNFVYKLILNKTEQMRNSQDDTSMKKEDILSRFLLANENDPTYLRDIILNFIIAGKDTTAATLSWFIYMLCKYPVIQEKVAQEVKQASNMKDITDFNEFAISLSEETLEKMHYLHAVINETLRLYPAVPVDAKICFCDDTLPDGFSVRKGDLVAYQPYAMGRMRFIWGDTAEEFQPQRWLGDDGKFRPESPFKFTAFQAGPRICLGKEFAYRQMKIFSAVLLRCFVFKMSDEKNPVNYRTMINLHIDGGLHVLASHRY
ncbi:p450 domain-containing protein [Cephalotus follicularis]|uniref:p450 domain-containing protein n=1 Tax=Cephalotus follicularis TaxID=3775 RepID=A0A1Q3C6I9_CEPFO|nr:p450 domain-containing protein [Cephalotus follicularis]